MLNKFNGRWAIKLFVRSFLVVFLILSLPGRAEDALRERGKQRQNSSAANEGQGLIGTESIGDANESSRLQTNGANGQLGRDTARGRAPPPPPLEQQAHESEPQTREPQARESAPNSVEKKLEKVAGPLGNAVRRGATDKHSSTIVDALARLGFEHELHDCVSLDGYTTQLVRMVNPHLNSSQLRSTPVVLYTGQGTSPAVFLAAALSSGGGGGGGDGNAAHNWHNSRDGEQSDELLVGEPHHEAAAHSANRSLAVLLSNSGFDVWLVPTRGVDAQSRARNSSKAAARGARHHHGDHREDHRASSTGSQSEDEPATKQVVKRSLDGQPKAGGDLAAKLVEAKQLMVRIGEENKPKFGVDPGNETKFGSDWHSLEFDPVAKLRQFVRELAANSYWSFSNDEIIANELEQQLECVRSVSGARKLSLISYSNGGFVVFGFLARRPIYAQQHLDAVVNLAPAVFVNKLNMALSLAGLASNLNLFDAPFPEEQFGALGRKLCQTEPMRSTACRAFLEQLYGPSELFGGGNKCDLSALFEHYLARPMSGPALRQSLQVAYGGRMQEYDHGPVGNLIVYNRPQPSPYELERVKHERLFVFSGQRDAIVDPSSLVLLMGSIGCKPESWTKLPQYNHLDFVLAQDNDEQINSPVLKILTLRDLEVDYYRQEEEEQDSGHEHGGVRDEKDRQDDANESSYFLDHDADSKGDSNAPGSYKSRPKEQLAPHSDHAYEGHTTSADEQKSYDNEHDELTDQSAQQPVAVKSAANATGRAATVKTSAARSATEATLGTARVLANATDGAARAQGQASSSKRPCSASDHVGSTAITH